MSEGILLFDNGSSSGSAGGNAFDQAEFLDTSLPATNNTGFSSTLSRNPMGDFFANDLAPKYGAKELFFSDLQLVSDKSKWISGRPTYKILFTEQFTGVDAYAFGNVQVRGTDQSRYFVCLDAGDGVSVVGTMVNVSWNFLPVSSTTGLTAAATTDGNSIGTLPTSKYYGVANNGFGGGIYTNKTISAYQQHSSTNQSFNVHNYQITANQPSAIAIQSIQAYFEIPGLGIDLFAGGGFVNKSAVLAVGSSLAYPLGLSNLLGGIASIYITQGAAFGATFSPVPSQQSIAIGSSGTNQLALTSGTGASFPAGSGIYVKAGTSTFLGYVASVSTDTLTLGNTLPFGASGTISTLLGVGTSYPISATLFSPFFSFEPSRNHEALNASLVPVYPIANQASFPILGTTGLFTYSDPQLRYRVTGWSLNFTYGSSFVNAYPNALNPVPPINDVFGMALGGATQSLEIAGRFSALDIEMWCGVSAILGATFVVDGFAYGSLGENVSGPGRINRTLVGYAGAGWHTIKINSSGSTQILITRVRGYEPFGYNGPSFGLLANIQIGQTFIVNPSTNVTGQTFTSIGNIQRIYADNFNFTTTGGGAPLLQSLSGASFISTGGVGYLTETGGNPLVNFFGKGFCVSGSLGTTLNTGFTGFVIANGISSGLSLGFWVTYPSATFISVQVVDTTAVASNSINCIDILKDDSVVNRQNYYPVAGVSSVVSYFNSPTAPIGAKAGDIWQQNQSVAYQNLFNGWQQMNVAQPGCAYVCAAVQGVTNSGQVALFFDTVVSDPYGMGSTSATTGSNSALATFFNIPVDGNYLVNASVGFAGTGSSSLAGSFRLLTVRAPQGAMPIASYIGSSTSEGIVLGGNLIVPNLKKAQQISMSMSQNSGVGLTLSGAAMFFNCQRIGP